MDGTRGTHNDGSDMTEVTVETKGCWQERLHARGKWREASVEPSRNIFRKKCKDGKTYLELVRG